MGKVAKALGAVEPLPRLTRMSELDDDDRGEIARLHIQCGFSPRRIVERLREADIHMGQDGIREWLKANGFFRSTR